MTVILAARSDDGVFIGADRRSSDHMDFMDDQPKLVRVANFYVGGAGSVRVKQLIKYNRRKFNPITRRRHVFNFGETLRKLLKDYEIKDEEIETEWVLACPEGIYVMYQNFQFHEQERWAVGSGGHYGMGYYDAATGTTPERITSAIEACSRLVHTVGGGVTVKQVH